MITIDYNNLPKHIAIIMDGNGRWAAKNLLGRISGHAKGARSVRHIVKACRQIGIKYLTLYAFSVENWHRPSDEVEALMNLLESYLRSELKDLQKNDIRLVAIGDIDALRESTRKLLKYVIAQTAQNQGMVFTLAISYGGRDEIICAVKRLIRDFSENKVSIEEINKEYFSCYLYTNGIPDPDLIIRTSGEYRLSNFLLWQSAYAELYFTKVLWPDFRKKHLIDAIVDFQGRERRFGLTSGQIQRD